MKFNEQIRKIFGKFPQDVRVNYTEATDPQKDRGKVTKDLFMEQNSIFGIEHP